MRPLSLVLLAALPTFAWAVLPPEGTRQGFEPVRVRTFEPGAQAYWGRQEAWQRFTEAAGAGWEARFDELTGTPHRAWGPGLALGPVGTEAEVREAVSRFVASHPELLGLGDATAVVRSAARFEALDAWYVDVDTLHEGLPVWRGGLTFRIREGRLVMFGAETYPEVPVRGEVRLSEAQARAAFVSGGPVPFGVHTFEEAAPMLLPRVVGGKGELRTVWVVHTRTEAPLGHWEGFVDAASGEVIGFHNRVRYLDGRLDIEHDARIGDGTLTTSPLRGATIVSGSERAVTGLDGTFTLPTLAAPEVVAVELEGPRVSVRDQLGALAPLVTGGEQLLRSGDFLDRLAAPSTFIYVQQVQDFARSFAPEVGWVDFDVTVNVNIDDVCNAWFDGTLNFLRAGDGCRNTGRLADVIFHEWGHGFHNASILSGSFDGSLGEGAADVMSAMLTDDPRIAPSFFDSGARELRNVRNRQRYPEDFRGDATFVHSNGLIFGGSMWDVREALRVRYGEPRATEELTRIYAGLLKGGPSIVTAYDEAVFVDDDDADLGNGTPHRCELVEGFGKHGLGPVGGFGTNPEIPNPEQVDVGVDVVITGTVPNPAPECVTVTPEKGSVRWRVNGGDWSIAWVEADGLDIEALIPAEALSWGDVVEYYAAIDTSAGGTVYDPPGGEIRPHTFYVGDVLEVRCDDFEADDGGYSHRLIAGTEQEGADDWAWGTPLGLSGDPASAFSGTKVWGNDLGGGEYDGAYQDGKHNQLRSPRIDTFHYQGLTLRYQRWLAVEDGIFDQARILANDVEVWSNWGTSEDVGNQHHLDDRWAPHFVPLQGQGEARELRLAWEITSDQGLHFGGWTVDDVCVYAPATPNNRLGVSDLVASRSAGRVSLAWTQPRHAPVQEVRLVRKRGSWPTGAQDGDVVWSTTTVELAGAASFVDEDVEGPDWYYAVYASDGEAWLTSTREGFNAAAIDPIPASEKACGCSSTSSGTGLGLALFGLVAVRRRSSKRIS